MVMYRQTKAGLGISTEYADFDFETYSEAGYYWDTKLNKWREPDNFPSGKPGLQSIGAAKYAEHTSTEVVSLAWDLKDGLGVRQWIPGQPPPYELFQYIKNGGVIAAWHSLFEYWIWNKVCHEKYGWPPLPLNQIICDRAKAACYGLPASLDNAARVISPDTPKDPRGKQLIKLLSVPHTPTKKFPHYRRTRQTHPELFTEFDEYGIGDVVAESGISKVVPDLSEQEYQLFLIDQRINIRGVHIDVEGVKNCIRVFEQARDKYTQELQQIVGVPDLTVNQLDVIKKWMGSLGFPVGSLDKDAIKALLKNENIPPPCRRVLEIRQVLGAANVKKLFAIDRYLCNDNRLHGLYVYYGARQTGRFSGTGPQAHNITTSGPPIIECKCCTKPYYEKLQQCPHCGHVDNTGKPPRELDWSIEPAELVLEDLKYKNLQYIEDKWGDPIKAISGVLRACFTAAPGYELICSDFSAIEAVCLAAEAGEEWRLEVFRTHGEIYEMSASKISGVPFEEFLEYKKAHGQHHPLRKKLGKVAELASGYSGWINAWKNFGADKFMDDKEIKKSILGWRAASPKIVEMWGGQWRKHPDYWEWWPEMYGIEGAAVMAVLNPRTKYSYRGISYFVYENVLYCRLYSGRHLTYHKPELYNGFDPLGHPIYKLTYEGWNSDSNKGPVGWIRRETYGGQLVENITQAVARDLFAFSLVNLENSGYPVVLHTHDEITSEVPTGHGTIEEFEKIMSMTPDWAKDWPVKAAGGWRGMRYRKD